MQNLRRNLLQNLKLETATPSFFNLFTRNWGKLESKENLEFTRRKLIGNRNFYATFATTTYTSLFVLMYWLKVQHDKIGHVLLVMQVFFHIIQYLPERSILDRSWHLLIERQWCVPLRCEEEPSTSLNSCWHLPFLCRQPIKYNQWKMLSMYPFICIYILKIWLFYLPKIHSP